MLSNSQKLRQIANELGKPRATLAQIVVESVKTDWCDLSEIVLRVLNAGYRTDSKDFAARVYRTVMQLVREGVLITKVEFESVYYKFAKIDWARFFDNTSSREALYDFAEGKPFRELMSQLWDKNCQNQAIKLKYLTNARKLAKRAYNRHA